MSHDLPPVVGRAFERAPAYLFSCNGFTEGVYRRPKSIALTFKNVQVDKRGYCSVILIDIDRSGAANVPEDVGLPPPSWVCINPKNGHAHVAYVLDDPVVRSDSVIDRPARYLRVVRRALNHMLGGDMNYPALMTKNPFSKDWIVRACNKSYSLGELAEYIPDELLRCQYKFTEVTDPDVDLVTSRNKRIFDVVRSAHYPKWQQLVKQDKATSLIALLTTARQANVPIGDSASLPEQELLALCRSIDKFLRLRYEPTYVSHKFKKRQTLRQQRSAKQRRINNVTRLENAAFALSKKGLALSISALARESGLSRQALYETHKSLCENLISNSKKLMLANNCVANS